MSANFTPTKGAYTELKPFRFWCQKVLPLVYDDSLSYYELLCKVVDYLNKTMEDVDTLNTDVTNLFTAYDQLQDWVNAYYDSEDFEAAIDAGLDRMAEDGRLDALITPVINEQLPGLVDNLLPEVVLTLLPDEVSSQIGGTVQTQLPGVVSNQIGPTVQTQLPGVVSNQIPGTVASQLPAVVSNQIGPVVEDKIVDPVEDWLSENVTAAGAVDRTLSILGAGADAAFTGERVKSLDEAVGYEHIADTGITTTSTPYVYNDGNIINTKSAFSDQESHTYKETILTVAANDQYCINAHKISIYRTTSDYFAITYAICYKWIGDPDTDIPYYVAASYNKDNTVSNATVTIPEITIPSGQGYDPDHLYLIVLTANIQDPVYKIINEGIRKDVTSLKDDLTQIQDDLTQIQDDIYEASIETIDTSFDSQGLSDFWNAGYISASGTITDGHAAYRYSNFINVKSGDTVNYTNLRAINSDYSMISAYDSNGVFLQDKSVTGTGSFETGSYTVTGDVAKIRVTWYWSTNYVCTLSISSNYPVTDKLAEEIDAINEKMLTTVQRDFTDLTFTEQYVDKYGNIVNRGTITNRLSNKIYNCGRDVTYTKIRGLVNGAYALAAFGYDDTIIPAKSIITDGTSGSGSYFTASGSFTFTDDVAYIRLGYYLYDQQDMSATWYEEINSFDYIESLIDGGGKQWSGKSWVAFGTSITDTNNTLAPDGSATGKYVPYLKALSGMTVTNYGIAGASIGYNEGYVSGAILTKIKSSDSLSAIQSADLITIEGFVNDFVGNVPVGQLGDTTNLTLIGAIYDAVTYISTQNPNATIVLLTDTTGRYTDSGNLPVTRQNALNKYQYEYIDAIVSIGKYLNIHVINCGQKSQIDQWHTQYLIDHIHQTELGGAQYAATIWDELKNIHCNADVVI